MAHGFRTWDSPTGAANVMKSTPQPIYDTGNTIVADNVNAPIKQANLIGVGLINALGITDDTLDADSTTSAIAGAINTALTNKVSGTKVTNAVNADITTQLGTTQIGNSTKPIYLLDGYPLACDTLYVQICNFNLEGFYTGGSYNNVPIEARGTITTFTPTVYLTDTFDFSLLCQILAESNAHSFVSGNVCCTDTIPNFDAMIYGNVTTTNNGIIFEGKIVDGGHTTFTLTGVSSVSNPLTRQIIQLR